MPTGFLRKKPASTLRAVLASLAGGLCAVLGLLVLVGWHTHIVRLLTIYPGFVAMSYNAALGFLLGGAALLAAALGRSLPARVGAACVAAIGLLTLSEYVFGLNLGIDELLMKAYIRAGILNYARMAVCTALCFALAGTALLLSAQNSPKGGRWRQGATGLLGALIMGLGIVAFSGYFTGITTAYAWGQLTRMAVHTAVGFIVLGSGIIALAWQRDCEWQREPIGGLGSREASAPRWLPLIVGIGVATVTLCLWQALIVQQAADLALILRLEAANTSVHAMSLVQTQSLIPLGCLSGGLLLALLLTWAIYLAQTAGRRRVEIEATNGQLQVEITTRKEAEEAVRGANAELERRVQERTADLATVNDFLQHEVAVREQAEAQLEQQREFLRSVIDMDPNLIFVKDYDGKFTLVNEATARLYGATPDDLIGKSDRDFNTDEAEVEHFLRVDRAVIETLQDKFIPEEKITGADGGVRWLQTVKRPLVVSGAAPCLLGIATDITERKRQEGELLRHQAEISEQRAFLRQVIDAVPSVIFVKDEVGRYTLVNQVAAEWFGRPAEDVIGKTDLELVPEGLAERFRQDDHDVLRTRQDKYVAEALFTDLKGRNQWFQTVKRALVSPGGTASHLLGVGTDITERKQQQAELSEQRAFLRQVLDTAPSCIFVKDEAGRYIMANAATARMFGMTVEEFVGKCDADLMTAAQAEQFLALDREVLVTGQDMLVPARRVIGAGGREYWIETIKRPFSLHDGTSAYTLGVGTDVTERRALETERERLQAQVAHSEKLAALGELVAGVAHEINNPLAAILGNAELLGMHPDPQVREDADAILRMSQRANRIVRSLLTFARTREGERRYEALNPLVEDTLEMAAYKLRKANVGLAQHLQEPAPVVSVDANEIQQVILNLVNNAEHALRHNEGPKTVTIQTGTQEQDGVSWATVSVTDNGCGMPEEVRSRIFDPFFTTKGVGEGTGLGLSICHGIAEAHGGTLTVESAVGVGTTFTLALPLAHADTLPELVAA